MTTTESPASSTLERAAKSAAVPSLPDEEHLPSREIYARLLGFVRPYWGIFLVGTICSVIASTTDALFAKLLKPLTDQGFSGHTDHPIWLYPVGIVVLFVIRGLFTFINSYAMAYVGNKVLAELRQRMFDKMITLPTSFFDDNASSKLVSRIVFEASNVMGTATSVLTNVGAQRLRRAVSCHYAADHQLAPDDLQCGADSSRDAGGAALLAPHAFPVTRQHEHDWRTDPGGAGDHRLPESGQDLRWRRGSQDAPLPTPSTGCAAMRCVSPSPVPAPCRSPS